MTWTRPTFLLAVSAAAAAAFGVAQVIAQSEAPAIPTVGAEAPAYALPDQTGVMHSLAGDKGKPVLLAFYPADFTGGCTLEAHSLSSSYKDLKALGVTVYGVSVQDSKSHQGFCTKEGIPYNLLADTDKKMAEAYGVLIPGAGIADRVTFLIGADGKIAYVDKNVNGHLNTAGPDWVQWIKAHPAAMQNSESKATASLAFTLPNTATGAATSLDTLAQGKKATVVLFTSTQCPYSNAYNDRMESLSKKYGPKQVAFVAIDANSTEATEEIAAHAKKHGFSFPVLKDSGAEVAKAYDAHVTPEAYVIDSSGALVYHGRIDNDADPAQVKTHDLAAALDATLAGKPVAKARTKAFGCSIKR